MTEKMKIKLTVIFLSLLMLAAIVASICIAACGVGTNGDGQDIIQNEEVTDEEGAGDGSDGEEQGSEEQTPGEVGETDAENPAPVPDVSDKLVFTLNEGETAYTVTDMDSSAAGTVTIPASYNGLPVTDIAERAFYNCSSLTAITIPEGVTSIGSSAFYGCSGLTAVTIPEGITNIGSFAFYNCSNLTAVTIPEGVTSIGPSAFYNCSSLTGVTIPASVESIGALAFRDCSSLTEINYNAVAVANLAMDSSVFYNAGRNSDGITVVFGESVTSIPNFLFFVNSSSSSYAPNLASVIIGSNVTSIGIYAFQNCSNLTSVMVGGNVTSIGNEAFRNCSNLTSATFENTVGWRYAETSTATSWWSISSSALANPSTAAEYLMSEYYDYYWRRS